jgi:hypothetical protein
VEMYNERTNRHNAFLRRHEMNCDIRYDVMASSPRGVINKRGSFVFGEEGSYCDVRIENIQCKL